MLKPELLIPGNRYDFALKPSTTPRGKPIPGGARSRVFIQLIGTSRAKGNRGVTALEVRDLDGNKEVFQITAIESVR